LCLGEHRGLAERLPQGVHALETRPVGRETPGDVDMPEPAGGVAGREVDTDTGE
jgi:hypothetical protein